MTLTLVSLFSALIIPLSLAGTFSEGPGESTPAPFADQVIEHKATFFLDKKTFDAHQIKRIGLEAWLSGDRFGWNTQYEVSQKDAYEGTFITLEVHGPAGNVERVFDFVLTNIVSAVHTKGGWVWALPSDSYKANWDAISTSTRKEIRMKAFHKWLRFAGPSSEEILKTCEFWLR